MVTKVLFPLFFQAFHHVNFFQLPCGKRKGHNIGCRYEHCADEQRFPVSVVDISMPPEAAFARAIMFASASPRGIPSTKPIGTRT